MPVRINSRRLLVDAEYMYLTPAKHESLAWECLLVSGLRSAVGGSANETLTTRMMELESINW
jgi:hypothetical protein